VRALERLTHGHNRANALEREVGAAVGLLDNDVDNRAAGKVERIDALGAAELGGKLELARIGVDADDARGAGGAAALRDRGAHRTETPNRTNRTRLHFGSVDRGAIASGDATAEETAGVDLDVRTNDSAGDLRQHSVLGERRATHEVKDSLALAGEARSAVRHETLALIHTQFLAQIRLATQTELALLALWHIAHDDVVADLDTRHARANRLDHTAAFVAQNRRKHAFRIAATQRVRVRVAHATRVHANTHLARFRRAHFNLFNAQWLLRLPRNGCFALDRSHSCSLSLFRGGFLLLSWSN
jgi:hypothetical protein